MGYEPDPSTPSISLQGEKPNGVAIDQSNQRIYVAIPFKSVSGGEFGQIDQLESNGVPTAASPFTLTGQPLFTGVAVNPGTNGIYTAEGVVSSPVGILGTSRIDQFSSSGTLGMQFPTGNGPGVAPKIATDSTGDVYYPNATANTVQVFNSAGSLQETISCGGCPGGGFSAPNGVAIDSEGNLYVVEPGNDQVVKLTRSGGSYIFAAVIQSGDKAAAVAVDPSDNSVFVGDYASGSAYHIVAYNSSGVQFDDFGAGLFTGAQLGNAGAGQIAVNATTHKLYVSDPDANLLRVFDLVTIHEPTATTNPASSVGQVSVKLNATVNANLHATTNCHFEYVEDGDFQVNGYANATEAPCSSLPVGSGNTSVSASLTNLLPSTNYDFRVVAANNAGPTSGSSLTFMTLPAVPPTVTAGLPTGVTQTIATLTGKANPHGGTVSNCHFEYGVGESYATSVPCPTAIGPVTTEVSESLKVTGLSPKTSYHYRLSVTSNAGTVVSSGEELTTLPPAPTIATVAASGITQAGATISGTINPNGATSSCHFQYGTTTAYGSIGACPTEPGSGEGVIAEHLDLAGLAAGTTYHYRLVGTSPGGTVNGLDLSFTTESSPISQPATQSELPQLVVPPVVTPPKALKCKKSFQKKKVRGKLRCVRKKHRHH